MAMVKRSYRVEEKTLQTLAQIAAENDCDVTELVNDALRRYCDFRYLNDKATVIPAEIEQVFDDKIKLLESRINAKSNKLLSEMAIQQGIMATVLSEYLQPEPGYLDAARRAVVEYMRINNKPMRFDEL